MSDPGRFDLFNTYHLDQASSCSAATKLSLATNQGSSAYRVLDSTLPIAEISSINSSGTISKASGRGFSKPHVRSSLCRLARSATLLKVKSKNRKLRFRGQSRPPGATYDLSHRQCSPLEADMSLTWSSPWSRPSVVPTLSLKVGKVSNVHVPSQAQRRGLGTLRSQCSDIQPGRSGCFDFPGRVQPRARTRKSVLSTELAAFSRAFRDPFNARMVKTSGIV